jgi:ABC-type dipeptide/oligopeptide/nickel transport system permease component
MASFLLRRTLQLLLVLWGGATILFVLFFVISGNPAERMASGGGSRNPPASVVKNLEVRFGLDKSKPEQYKDYFSGVLKGDFKESFRTREPVLDIAKAKAPTSFRLAFWAVIIVASVGTAILARITRTSMLETMRLDHVRTARAKGLSEKHVMRRHVLRNAMIPVITVLGIDFGTMVGAAVLTETVFNLGGLGSQIVAAAKDRDIYVVLGLTLIVTFVYGVASMLVDLSYAYFNPRGRLGDD